MRPLNLDDVVNYVNENIVRFHENKLRILNNLDLRQILRKKNPYLFRAKNLNIASDLIRDILDAYLSSSEEKLFGDFLEELVIFISEKVSNGRKSAATGIDLEFSHNNTLYLISIKSGPNWGNSSQQRKQEQDFQNACKILKQSNRSLNIQPVLGICYGKTRTTYPRGYMKVVGQNFWYLISGNENLYIDIIEPLGYQAKKHNEAYLESKGHIINLFTQKFMEDFCDDGQINWVRLVEFNSGNLDIDLSK